MKKLNSLYTSRVDLLQNIFFFSAGDLLLTFCKNEIRLSGFLQIKTRSLRLEMVTNLNT